MSMSYRELWQEEKKRADEYEQALASLALNGNANIQLVYQMPKSAATGLLTPDEYWVNGKPIMIDWRGKTFVDTEFYNEWNTVTNDLNTTIARINALVSAPGYKDSDFMARIGKMSGLPIGCCTRFSVFWDRYHLPLDHPIFTRIKNYTTAYEIAIGTAINSNGKDKEALLKLACDPEVDRLFELNAQLIQQQLVFEDRLGAPIKEGRRFIIDRARELKTKKLKPGQIANKLLIMSEDGLTDAEKEGLRDFKKSADPTQYIRDCLNPKKQAKKNTSS